MRSLFLNGIVLLYALRERSVRITMCLDGVNGSEAATEAFCKAEFYHPQLGCSIGEILRFLYGVLLRSVSGYAKLIKKKGA